MISTFTLSMEPDDYRSPRIGRRIKVHEHTGTIRYIGEVQDTRGIWLGIEWDDPARGKHSGQKDGRQYFSCRVAGTGSFIRPSPSISYGQSFLHALISKYVDLPHTTGHKETVILGSSNGAIEVEAVGLDKVRAKLARFERLREISLDVDEVAWADPLGDIKKACPNVRSLDLSNSLLPSWDMVALIAAELSALRALSLNCNRFSTLTDTKIMHASFLGLKELRVDQTMISWPEVITLTSVMPNIEYLEVGYNDMKILGGTAFQNYTSATKLKILNFDGNELEEWSDVMMSTASFTTLERLILTSNRIRRIMLAEPKKAILNIKHIGLQDNLLSSWHDIDALNEWVPELQTLNISGNPLVSGSSDFRQQAIARLPSLLSLNGTSISIKERNDCEIYYLSHIARSSLVTEEERMKGHPRWKELCDKHGAPDRTRITKGSDTLAGRLISISVHRYNTAELAGCAGVLRSSKAVITQLPPPLTLRVLPTMTMRSFRLKLLKALRLSLESKLHDYHLAVWLLMNDDDLTTLDLGQEERDLAWWGIQNGSHIIVHAGEY